MATCACPTHVVARKVPVIQVHRWRRRSPQSTTRALFLVLFLGTICLRPSEDAFAGQAQRIEFEGISYATYKVDLDRDELRLFWKSPCGLPYGSLGGLRDSLDAKDIDVLFSTNAGIFDTTNCPLGLHIEDGQVQVALNDTTGYGNFFLKPNGVFSVAKGRARIVRTESWEAPGGLALATQSGPLLVESGRLHPAFRVDSQHRFIRNGVGVGSHGEVFFAISEEPVTLHQFACFFRDRLGCRDALYLDGAISAMYLPDLGLTDAGGGFVGILAVIRGR